MSSRFGPPPTQNNNNHMSDRSSTRCVQPPGGGSTMGSLIYGDNTSSNSFMDERKTRRFQGQAPEQNPIVDKNSFYGKPSSAQLDRDRVTAAPGAMPRAALVTHHGSHQQTPQQQQQPALLRHGSSNNNMADCLNGSSGVNEGDNQRRTRRMCGPPGGASSFKLG